MATATEPAQYQGTGKRKTSVARVILRPGDGATWFNARTVDDYFPRLAHRARQRVLARLAAAFDDLEDDGVDRETRLAHEQARGFELDSVCRSWQRLLTTDLAPGAGPAYEDRLSGAQVPG